MSGFSQEIAIAIESDARTFPTQTGIQTVLDELNKEPKAKPKKFEDFVDLRALRVLEQEEVFK